MGVKRKLFFRFCLRQYALFGALLCRNSKERTQFREKIDTRIISLFRDKIERFIRQYPSVWTEEETLYYLIEKRASICRFGDGEFKLIVGEAHKSFQDVNADLNRRMLEVLQSDVPNVLIGVFPVRNFEGLGRVWQKFIIRIGDPVLNILDLKRSYPSMGLFRVLPTTNRNDFINRVKLIKQVWQDRKVLLVTGKGSRFTFEEELFNNTISTEFLYTTAKNAFANYDTIFQQILSYKKEDYLVLLVLGPTATVLAYDLAKYGYQAIDFGQMPTTFRKGKKKLFGDENYVIPELSC